jgi:phosphohistidine phosphatase SixA
MQVFLVRHAHAGDRESFHGPDQERPLSEKGRRQAAGLVRQLQDAEVMRVLSSPYLRCVQTVGPLAQACGLTVEEEPSLAEGSDWRETLGLVEGARVPTVMCSQGDVIGSLVMHLVDGGFADSAEGRWQKGSTWELETEAGAVVAARYLGQPA